MRKEEKRGFVGGPRGTLRTYENSSLDDLLLQAVLESLLDNVVLSEVED